MRLINLSAFALTCLIAGSSVPQDEVTFGIDLPHFRGDCDDWETTLPSASDYWTHTNNLTMSMTEAIAIGLDYVEKESNFLEVRVLQSTLVLAERPYYRIEVLTHHFNANKEKDIYRRWEMHVGNVLKKVKTWRKLERFPGTPVIGEIDDIRPSGLQVHDVHVGDGKLVTADSIVKINYTLTLLDGTLVISTYQNREPQTFHVSDAIVQGMVDGLPGAHRGGKRKLIVPPSLGYGDEGFGTQVPPGATLVYDLEIMSVTEDQ